MEELEIFYLIIGINALKRVITDINELPGFFDFFYIEPMFREETKFAHHLHLNRKDAEEVEELLNLMYNEFVKRERGFKVVIEALLRLLFVKISRCYYNFSHTHLNSAGLNIKRKAVKKVISYIEKHYSDEIKLKDLAFLGCLQSEYLCRVFKEQTGMTMFEYLNRIRIEYASRKLETTNMPISEICFEVGPKSAESSEWCSSCSNGLAV